MSSIRFYDVDVKLRIKNKRILSAFIPLIFSNENKKFTSLSIISCSDEYLLRLNRQFLDHDYYTDILTFDLSIEQGLAGEIYISLDRVKENSIINQISFLNEFYRILFHGILHLCGYLDKSIIDKKEMTKKEDFYLDKFSMFHVKQH